MRRIEEDTWITQKAAEEDGAFIAAGHIGIPQIESTAVLTTDALAARVSFARFVELARLKLRLSKEQFAVKARIPLEELVCIEADDVFTPTLRTVHYLAQFLKVSHPKLLSLAGLAHTKDAGFNSAAVKFAAKSEPIRQLTKEEQEAFDEFVKVLSDR
jgi:HTH-type transcriptional regulator, competence development regulator